MGDSIKRTASSLQDSLSRYGSTAIAGFNHFFNSDSPSNFASSKTEIYVSSPLLKEEGGAQLNIISASNSHMAPTDSTSAPSESSTKIKGKSKGDSSLSNDSLQKLADEILAKTLMNAKHEDSESNQNDPDLHSESSSSTAALLKKTEQFSFESGHFKLLALSFEPFKNVQDLHLNFDFKVSKQLSPLRSQKPSKKRGSKSSDFLSWDNLSLLFIPRRRRFGLEY